MNPISGNNIPRSENQTTFRSDVNPAEIIQGMSDNRRLLTSKNEEYLKKNKEYACAKEAYQIALSTKIMDLKSRGEPITTAREIARGNRHVAGLEKNMIIAEGVMKACRDSMSDIRSDQDGLRSLLSWLKAEMQSL